LAKALLLLDSSGTSALSIRSVANAAGTSTPTLYDRFENSEALSAAITKNISEQVVTRLSSFRSLEDFAREYIRYVAEYPHRYELLSKRKAKAWETDEPRPVYSLLVKLVEGLKRDKKMAQQLALAILALLHGTALLTIAAGVNTKASTGLVESSMLALRLMLKPSGTNSRNKNSQ
jgi:AcrR family transcriptional regulator